MNQKIDQPAQKNISWRLVCFLIVVMAATGIYSCKNNNANSGQTQQAVADSSKASHDSLVAQVNAARLQVDDLTSKTAALDSQIQEKDMQIAKLNKEVGHLSRKNRALVARLRKDKRLISSLKDELDGKTKSYAENLGLLQSDRDNLVRQRDSLMGAYTSLKQLGSVLHVSNFRLEPVHLKHHGKKAKETMRAHRVDELRIYFDIDENRIADNGTKDLYVVITDPQGTLLSNKANKSGAITTSTGRVINYSVLKQIPLIKNEPVKDVTVDWNQDSDYKKGTYNISIYNGGYRIGGGNVELR